VRGERADLAILILALADADVDEAPGERFGIVSVETPHRTSRGALVGQIQGQKW
jgi:hypothetical protein